MTNANDPNIELVMQVAYALGPLRKDLVFVGGCAVGLLVTDLARPPVRATKDVDLIAEVTTKGDYYSLARALRQAGFSEDNRDDVICRWRFREMLVDVMPTNESILGFSNRWYLEAVRSANTIALMPELEIKLVTPPLLIATKIEAFYGRGKGDYGSSHDIEDVIVLVDGRPELVAEIAASDESVRSYLRSEIDDLLADHAFVDTISWHLDPQNQARVPIVLERLRALGEG
jgi:predicted nucleotidyltransferase